VARLRLQGMVAVARGMRAPCDDGTVNPISAAADDVSTITREALIGALRSRGIVLVDVLSPESFAARHIPGAVNLPVAEIERRAAAVLPDRRAPVVVYCGGPT
jgi:3-mercaptopyruvate sulfurtransferase SseA